MRHSRPGTAGRLALLVLAGLVLSACGPGRPGDQIVPPPSAGDPACVALLANAPRTLLGRARVSTDALGTAAWGDPAIMLSCGFAPPGPSTEHCINVNGTDDWLFTEDQDTYSFVTYGRSPAAELEIPKQSVDRTQAAGALSQLSPAIRSLKITGRCVGLDDVPT